MTVNDLIEKLKTYPGDMEVRFTADMGYIEDNNPIFTEAEATVAEPPCLYIEISS